MKKIHVYLLLVILSSLFLFGCNSSPQKVRVQENFVAVGEQKDSGWLESTGRAILGDNDSRREVRSRAYQLAEENLRRKGEQVWIDRVITTKHGVTERDIQRLRSRVRLSQVHIIQDDFSGDYYVIRLRGIVLPLAPLNDSRVIEVGLPIPKKVKKRVEKPSALVIKTMKPTVDPVHKVTKPAVTALAKPIKPIESKNDVSNRPAAIMPYQINSVHKICLQGFPNRLINRLVPVLQALKGVSSLREVLEQSCYVFHYEGKQRDLKSHLRKKLRDPKRPYTEFEIQTLGKAHQLRLVYDAAL